MYRGCDCQSICSLLYNMHFRSTWDNIVEHEKEEWLVDLEVRETWRTRDFGIESIKRAPEESLLNHHKLRIDLRGGGMETHTVRQIESVYRRKFYCLLSSCLWKTALIKFPFKRSVRVLLFPFFLFITISSSRNMKNIKEHNLVAILIHDLSPLAMRYGTSTMTKLDREGIFL